MDINDTISTNGTVNPWRDSGRLRRRYINAAKKRYFYEVEQGLEEYSLAELIKRMRRAERTIDEAFDDFARQLATKRAKPSLNPKYTEEEV